MVFCFLVRNILPRGLISLLTTISRFRVYTLEMLANLPGTNPPRHRRLTILFEGYTVFWVYHSDSADGLFSRISALNQIAPDTQWPVSHGLGQNFDGGAGSRCPSLFNTGYGAHQGKKTGVLGAQTFFVLGTMPIKKKTSSGKTSSKQTLQGSSWTVQS